MYLKQGAAIGFLLVAASPVFADDSGWFSGVYGGLSYDWARSSATQTFLPGPMSWETPGVIANYSGSKNAVGGQIGYQTKVYTNVLLGVELSYTPNQSTQTVQSPTVAWHSDSMSFGDITMLNARAGYAADSWSVYGKAGYAQSKMTYHITDNAFPQNYFNLSSNVNGISYGIGAEYTLAQHYSLGIEHTRINWRSFSGVGAQVPAGNGAVDVGAKTNITSLRMNYVF